MAYTTTILAWSMLSFPKGYVQTKQVCTCSKC